MPHLSIVIPCLGGDSQFEDTLVSVLQNRPSRCEVLVVQPRAYADPYALGNEVRFVTAERAGSEAALVNAGVATARGDVIHVLGCGVCATEGWAEAGLAAFDDDDVASVSPVIVEPGETSRVIATGISLGFGGVRRVSHRIAGVIGPTRHAGFYRREHFEAVGGFQPRIGDPCVDVDLALSLRERGWRAQIARECIVRADWATVNGSDSPFRTGLGDERAFWRHARGGLETAVAHPLAVVAELFTESGHGRWLKPLGRLAGLLCAPWDVARGRRPPRAGEVAGGSVKSTAGEAGRRAAA